ncbi:Sir2 family NAD-dependent protein deacetylase [Priestia megaterium]|uniref:SIR2 family NAD-dependent protein deacylase n=1 Tax=Priestia megaterium TaxID=1404 RepID=UPI000BFE4A06|nr:SIR2 family protein [Priestia megaterium]PGX34584.1 Sir2 family NAD-dependent protein deacetylase [Priestia megaterium]
MKDLVKAIRDKKVILFVGAGVSASLGLPTFSQLIDHIAEQLGYDAEIFNQLGNGDYLSLAEYYTNEKGSIGELRSWMDVNWHKDSINIEESVIHKKIVDLEFPIIYTTNYDRWIEKAYDLHGIHYTKIKNVGDIRNIEEGKTQIIKFHGDFDDDQSIVLTESSYFERLNFESPLDIKLRSDILGKSILFIGYSLNDINIKYLLYRLSKIWGASPHSDLQPKSYVFLNQPNPIKEKILAKRGIKTLISKEDDPQKGLELFLNNLIDQTKGIN